MHKRVFALLGAVAVVLTATAIPALAQVNGPCRGSGTWDSGLVVDTDAIQPGQVIEIPLEDTVTWEGEVLVDVDGPRDVSGYVKVKVPWPVSEFTVGSWQDTSTITGNSGTYRYELASVFSGFNVTVTGAHWEGNREFQGTPTCTGEVTLTVEGTNPLGYVFGGLALVSVVGIGFAIRAVGGAKS